MPPTTAAVAAAGGPDVDAWALGVLKSLGMSSDARGTGGVPLGIHIDGLAHRPAKKTVFVPDQGAPLQNLLARRDSQRRREAVLKGKEGSRHRRRWENDRLLHVPNAQPPLPSDWEVRPTHPVHYGLPYHLAQYWDKGLRQHVNETRAAAAVLRRRQVVAQQAGTSMEKSGKTENMRVGTITRELRATAKKTPAVKTWVRVLEEPVRAFLQAAAAAKAAGHSLDGSDRDEGWSSGDEEDSTAPFYSDEEEDEIVFVGRHNASGSAGMWRQAQQQKKPPRQKQIDGGIVFDELGDDRDGSFKRWLTHSISDYYGLASHSVSVDSPPRRVVYVTLHEEMRASTGPQFQANRVEIWRITEDDHLVLFHSQMIFGTISMLQSLRPIDSKTELLFVGTDRFEYFTLTWDMESHSLRTVDTFQDVGEKHLRDSQSQDRCLVDPSGRFMALLLWEGVLTVLRLQTRRDRARPDHMRHLVPMDQVRLSELFIKASTFLHSETGQPQIAFLYQSQGDRAEAKLSAYRLTAGDRNVDTGRFDANRDREISMDIDDPGAALLIPVEKVEPAKRHNVRNTATATANLGGLLVVGETRLLYIDSTTKCTVEVPLRAASIFVAWARYDATHYLLADEYGTLHLLTILVSGAVVDNLDVSPIGKTSRASCLVYLPDRRLLFVGSHNGDSQLFRLDLAASPVGLHELQVLQNIAPVLDFTVMDMGNREDDQQLANEYASGQARIVTGSGVHKDGSLRSVRSGVGLEDIGILGDLGGVRGLFSLRSPQTQQQQQVDTLVASFLTETRVFLFDGDGEIEEVEAFPGLNLGTQTLLATNLSSGSSSSSRLLQITPGSVTLAETASGTIVASWTPPDDRTIVSASANSRWVLLSVEGTTLVSLSLDNSLAVAAQKEVGTTDQIACLHAAPQLLDVGVVGQWASGMVSVVDLATLEPKHGGKSLRRRDDNASVPRSIVLAQVLPPGMAGPTLFVAMDDGNVITFAVSPSDLSLSGRKSVVLGTRHARLHPLPQSDEATYSIFATTEHPSLIYGSEGRIAYAAVTAEDANFVCHFDAAAFPGAIAVATDSQIKLSRTDTTKQTHVRAIDMGETIRRIAYSATERVFALGCIKRELTQGREVVTSSLKLVDEVAFQPLGKPLALEVEGTELVECVVRAELRDALGNPAERFLVGTSFMAAGSSENEHTLGRILVVGVDSDHSPYIVSSHRVRGPCRCLAMVDDLIVAGLSKTVVLSRYTETSSMSGELKKVASYRTATYVVDLAVDGHMIAVGDMMKSTALVEYIPATSGDGEDEEDDGAGDNKKGKGKTADRSKTIAEGPKLVERARGYQASWATAVCHVEGDLWLEADGFGNLTMLERDVQGVTADDKRRLRTVGEMYLGEMVNRIRPIAVETSPGAMVHPRAFLATVEGSIYMVGTIAPEAQDLLMNLQTKLAAIVKGPGNTSFSAYRSFRNAERESTEPFRFVDGELLERFLDVGEDVQKEVAQGLGPSVEDLRNIIEELKRLH
ncbi:uv-damaged DNA-binding protein [Grosmannia clavigera kw1407]|uniref:Uv-damaged DNA-binding protein n=1 Tax=Grosmannia clavigera (strain kw1407 / UAMH 11150) TaxID=655863 RepID=F0X8D6_GROCL|nr:uv-damaged DNA-binding protein [Grosmannia clavigera kw1407]EFX05445.1 uv-damaged DNA-binding protein [Grosmannia clavigera kw1407]